MKKGDFERRLRRLGWWKAKEGANHEKWTNGELMTTVPRHREINQFTAAGILRIASEHRGKR